MALTKRKRDGKPEIAPEHKTTRVTRSSTRQGTTKVVTETKPKTKKAKVSIKEKVELKPKTIEELVSEGYNGSEKIVIEHCKQCNQFKIRAVMVKLGLENAVSGITVVINPEKPRRGCFEVREEGGKKFISLLDMKRPFAPMKALDMDGVISDIVEQIK